MAKFRTIRQVNTRKKLDMVSGTALGQMFNDQASVGTARYSCSVSQNWCLHYASRHESVTVLNYDPVSVVKIPVFPVEFIDMIHVYSNTR